jgi:hypothetical protein
VARGWAFWQLVRPAREAMGHVLPTGAGASVVLAGFVVASVQLGRRSVGVRNGRRVVLAAVNLVSVLCLLGGLTVVTSDPEPPGGGPSAPAAVATP